jgi:methionyl-tRNA synthetase
MSFYITTPLYYVNDQPHIGHAYTTIVADVLRRYHRLFGEETLFLTGTDEHGQKIQTAAQGRQLPPQQHCDEMVVNFQNIWKELEIDYDIFFRTTSDFHKKAVQSCLQELYDRDLIYAKDYEGWYSVSDEIFYTEKDLVDGKAPTGKEVTLIKETNYFFKMSQFQERLIAAIQDRPELIQPEAKRNEVLGFLKKPLQDLSISRPKTRLNWGIELPFDTAHVTYVWFDALLNYAVGVGFKRPGMEKEFSKWWNPTGDSGAIHLIGKDILTTHAVYWTTMLMALEAPLPKTIFAHGWWLTETNEKMSKSAGPTVKPLDVKNIVGVDGLRYFLTRDIHFGNDAQFSKELVISRVNVDLANNLGNLLSRTTNLVQKYFEGKIPPAKQNLAASQELQKLALAAASKVQSAVLTMAPNQAVEVVTDLLSSANKYLENHAPWKQLKEGQMEAGAEVLTTALEVLRIAAILLSPVMPSKMSVLLKQVGWDGPVQFTDAQKWGLLTAGTPVAKAEPLFPRIEVLSPA